MAVLASPDSDAGGMVVGVFAEPAASLLEIAGEHLRQGGRRMEAGDAAGAVPRVADIVMPKDFRRSWNKGTAREKPRRFHGPSVAPLELTLGLDKDIFAGRGSDA